MADASVVYHLPQRTFPLLYIAHLQETLQRVVETAGEVSAVLAVLEVPVVRGLLVRGQEVGDQDGAGGRPDVGVSGLCPGCVEGLHSLHHPGQGSLLRTLPGVTLARVGEHTVVGPPVVLAELHLVCSLWRHNMQTEP